MTLGNLDASSPAGIAVATFSVPTARSWWQWAGPRIDLSLPSFSGRTATVPDMLRYACRISANVRLCSPVAGEFACHCIPHMQHTTWSRDQHDSRLTAS